MNPKHQNIVELNLISPLLNLNIYLKGQMFSDLSFNLIASIFIGFSDAVVQAIRVYKKTSTVFVIHLTFSNTAA